MYVESRKIVYLILFAKQKTRHSSRDQRYRYQGGKEGGIGKLGLTFIYY